VKIEQSHAQTKTKVLSKPNIVLIIADDLGYGDVGFNGQQLIKTPNLDKLAASGMKFNQFYAGTSVCAPSRSALLSGLHTGHTYIRGNKGVLPEGQEPIADSVVTMAEVLKTAGYTTAAYGKWGLDLLVLSVTRTNKGLTTSTDTTAKPWHIVIIPIICGIMGKKLFWKRMRI
jgi:arylsulfatase A-like enzyme